MNNPSFNNSRSEERLSHIRQEYPHLRKSMTPFKLIGNTLWFICHFLFYLIQQVAEIFAPLLLVIGIIWKILPTATSSIIKMVSSSDPQTGEIIKHNSNLIPSSITMAGHHLTATGLITDGFLLLAITAFCATITVFLGRKL